MRHLIALVPVLLLCSTVVADERLTAEQYLLRAKNGLETRMTILAPKPIAKRKSEAELLMAKRALVSLVLASEDAHAIEATAVYLLTAKMYGIEQGRLLQEYSSPLLERLKRQRTEILESMRESARQNSR